ncbi:cytochrome P450 [Guyanagaster necrorhizus]|uniref:Cytochrome P450 n=1 Tax=Guyanagaster necrorhizus TaxID=856835 RepID=A0A9P7VKG9_9AGAR|nr:cytochrome P450 [Guyanagaster necrorhizus MCA 3950]KAG7441569.1 cytochrome P450 [Guyanagaster necrorhizus MCA 3950]
MTPYQITATDVCLFLVAVFLIYKISTNRKSNITTKLRGPPSRSWLYGLAGVIHDAENPGVLFEQWSSEYGSVYSVSGFLGQQKLVLCDPKAVAHFYGREGFGYVKPPMIRFFIEIMFGRNLAWAEGEFHRRQRKFLTPAFNNSAIRDLSHIFYDSAHRTSSAWDAILEASDGSSTIDVQNWMNRISMDSIGIAGFSHDFGAINGKPQVFDAVDLSAGATFFAFTVMVATVFPVILRLPSKRKGGLAEMKRVFSSIADQLLSKAKEHKNEEDKSVMGLLLKSETDDANIHMSREEIIAQVCLSISGYETTSISLTWALIELCRNVDIQNKLRKEAVQYGNSDPTWEHVNSSLPYLDAIVHETLRMHPPVFETTRMATEDDILPLSTPVMTKSGETVNSLFIAKGTVITTPIGTLNRSEQFWGPDAKEFKPERWLEDSAPRAKEIQGHRHLLTFIDGPRTCLGKTFALTEFKAVLFVIVRNFAFEFPGGSDTVIGKYRGSILPRPKVIGEEGSQVPLRVRRV